MQDKISWKEIKAKDLDERIKRHVDFWLIHKQCLKADVARALLALNFSKYAVTKLAKLSKTDIVRKYYEKEKWNRRTIILQIMVDVIRELKSTELYDRIKIFDNHSKQQLGLRS